MRQGTGGSATSAYSSLESRLTRLLEQYDARQDTHGVRFALAAPKRGWRWEWSSPGSIEQYFIASTTKLYVTALVMQLRAEGRLELDAPAARYLDRSVMAGMHILRGVDSSGRITIRELLSHTSGIADYFEQRQRDGSTQIGKALQADCAWTFDDVLRITRDELSPKFAPSTPGKAFYSDTNYQLLGAVIEAVHRQSSTKTHEWKSCVFVIVVPAGTTGQFLWLKDIRRAVLSGFHGSSASLVR